MATGLCFDYASSRLLYNSGYNLEFGYYSVGLLLNALCLKRSYRAKALDTLIFCGGPSHTNMTWVDSRGTFTRWW